MSEWSWLRTKSPKQIFMSDHVGNTLVCETMTHYFFLFCLFVCLLRYYVYIFYVTRTILGLTFLHPDTIETDFLFLFLFIRIWDTYYARVGCCKGAMLTPGFFPFFSIRLSREQYRAFEISIAPFVPSFVSSYRSRCLGSLVSPSPVLCATDSPKGCPVFLYAFSCLK